MAAFITRDTVVRAAAALPDPAQTHRDFIDVEVISARGRPAMIEFQKCMAQREDGEWRWGWEAVSCWES